MSAGNNIGVTAGTGGLLVQLAKQLTELQSATFKPASGTGSTVINGTGVTVKGGTSEVSLTQSGLNNGGNKITKVAAGTANDDAATVGQMNAAITNNNTTITNTLTDKGIKYAGNTGTEQTLKLGETLNVKGADNGKYITIAAGADGLTLDLASGVKTKLDNLPEDVVSGNQSLKFTAKDDKATDPQAFNKSDGLNFTITGDDSITTTAAGSSVTVKVAAGGIKTDHLANNAVTTDKLAADAVTTAKILNGTILEEDLAEALKTKINTGGDLADNTIALSDGSNSTTGQTLATPAIQLKIKGKDNSGITTNANGDTLTIDLAKATSVIDEATEGAKVVTSSVVYSAIEGAKTQVKIAEGSADVLGLTTDTSSGANVYTLSLNKAGLKTTLDTQYAAIDAGNLSENNVTSWKEKLGINSLATSSSVLTFAGTGEGSVDSSVALNKKLTVTDPDGLLVTKTEAVDASGNGKLNIQLSDTVKGKLNQIDTTAGVAKGTQTLELTAKTGTAGKQSFNKDGGLSFKVTGDASINTTGDSNGNITVSVADKGITTAKLADNAVTATQLANNAVTTDKILDKNVTEAKLADGLLTKINAGNTVASNTITLLGDSSSTTRTKSLGGSPLEFSILGSNDITTTASDTGDGKGSVTLALKKITGKAGITNTATLATSGKAVFEAITGAKTLVSAKDYTATSDENLLDYSGTGDNTTLGANNYTLGLSKKKITDLIDARVGNAGAGIVFGDGPDQAKDYEGKVITASTRTIAGGKRLNIVGDSGWIVTEFTDDNSENTTPTLRVTVAENVKNTIEQLQAGTASLTNNIKYHDASNTFTVTAEGEGLRFQGNTVGNVTTKATAGGIIEFGLNPDLSSIKSIGSGARDNSDDDPNYASAEARLTFKSAADGNPAEIVANGVQLTGLKDADLDKNSTDAVTGKQLYKLIGTNDTAHGSIDDRLADLEKGVKGTVVYTDANGNRLVKYVVVD